MKTSETTGAIYKALIAVGADMVNVKRNAINPFTTSFYSDLAKVLETVRPILAKHKLAVFQTVDKDLVEATEELQPTESPVAQKITKVKNYWPVVVTTRLIHESGEWIESKISSINEIGNAQQLGSLITYLRRYSLLAICGTAPEDDDDDAMSAIATQAELKGKAKPKTEGKPEGGKTANQGVTMQDRMAALPKDLKDLMQKAGAITLAQQWQLYKAQDGNLDGMRKACLKQIEENKAK